jgi:hypothetical protein
MSLQQGGVLDVEALQRMVTPPDMLVGLVVPLRLTSRIFSPHAVLSTREGEYLP